MGPVLAILSADASTRLLVGSLQSKSLLVDLQAGDCAQVHLHSKTVSKEIKDIYDNIVPLYGVDSAHIHMVTELI